MFDRISVNTSKKYDVLYGSNLTDEICHRQFSETNFSKVLLVIDENIKKLHNEKIEKLSVLFDSNCEMLQIKANEENKTLATVNKIYEKLSGGNFDRKSLIIAIGGGITGDIAGFAASTYMRGIKFVQIPTTLLSAVDSSIGGKTGVNYKTVKNIIGTFYQPEQVLIDFNFFKTLPEKELICGIGEILKYAFLAEKEVFRYMFKNLDSLLQLDEKILKKIVKICLDIKASVVSSDERETGLRKILNLGHTFAHAIESEQKYKIGHGQAVIIGLACSLYLSNKINIINDKELLEYLKLLLKFQGKVEIENCNVAKVLNLMRKDKKNSESKIKFVLVKNIGELLLDIEANDEDIIYSLNNGIGLFLR